MKIALDDSMGARMRGTVIGLLARVGSASTICPTEAARAVSREVGVEWRELMRLMRHVVAELAARDVVEVLQNDSPVDVREARGPLRMRLKRPRLY